jgi:hypothetical protein
MKLTALALLCLLAACAGTVEPPPADVPDTVQDCVGHPACTAGTAIWCGPRYSTLDGDAEPFTEGGCPEGMPCVALDPEGRMVGAGSCVNF